MIRKLVWAVAAAVLALTGTTGASATAASEPADNLTPGPYQHALDPLVGTWQAIKTNYVLSPDGQPIVSKDITVRTRWIAKTSGRFLEEETEGTLGGNKYFRVGVLGFSNIDRRYEWTTFDNVTPTSMTYRGPALTHGTSKISMPGQFTDPGILGPDYLGKTIPMRTVITIRSNEQHTFDLYFTPPGQKERLVDRVVYTRKTR
ncbi:DUF1579 family protein [Nonomuraea jiangxiensis]|uniref:DUF1579 domain-containing protein n=1 Tax=Nonomuraea jiangxiensis TaxID=633440 RepID=A0A1G9Q5Y5_9ACTN|nr:DUF1579 family protein [Nonomuraea jiangxiensis]SDM06462.1 Protein of unknown function [Nonomuraea jiangxiensis]